MSNCKRNVGIFAWILVLIIVLASAGVLAGSFSSSSYQYTPSYNTYYSSSQIRDYWPVLNDKDSCTARQDVLLQVSPVGCQPAVVRSDLLAEQNVPVFCQIDALEINPLVNIEEIKNIRFTGKYPAEVVGAGFHPALAALRTRDKLLGDPLASNVGYVVVVLKKTEREDDLPDFVSLNLSGQLEYETGNAFGIGRSEFVLAPVVDDNTWESMSSGEKNSFWQGRYFLRLEEADPTRATVSIYQGDKKIATTRVEKGKTSNDIYVPGSYCQAGLKVKYDGYVANENSVRIEIGENDGRDVIDLFENSQFLDGKCSVRKIEIDGVAKEENKNLVSTKSSTSTENGGELSLQKTGNVTIRCSGVSGDIKLELREGEVDDNGERIFEDKLPEGVDKEEFYRVIEAYKRVAEDYPQEREQQEGNRFGEDALNEALALAKEKNADKTRKELSELFLNTYPDSIGSMANADALIALQSIDFGKAAKGVEIDGRFKSLNLLSVKAGKSETSVEISVGGLFKNNAKQGEFLGESAQRSTDQSDRVRLEKIEADKVTISSTCKSDGSTNNRFELTEGESKEICGETINLRRINFEGIAKIRLEPKITGTKTETNLTVTIGIEKRAISLSPEKSLEKIENLNESIKKWEDISKNLGEFNKGLKTACFATAGVLTIKNFISGIDGSSLGRQQAMQGSNGWTERCENALSGSNGLILKDGIPTGKTYGSVVECFNDNSDLIEREVADRAEVINIINDRIPDDDSNGIVDNQKLTDEFYDKVKSSCGSALEDDFGKREGWKETTPWSLVDLREYCYANEMEKRGYTDFATSEKARLKAKVKLQTVNLQEFLNSKNAGGFSAAGYDAGSSGLIVRARIFDVNEIGSGDNKKISNFGNNGSDTGGATKFVIVRNARATTDKNRDKRGDFIIFGNDDTGRFQPTEIFGYSESNGIGELSNSGLSVGEFMGANQFSDFENLGDLHGNKIMPKDREVRFFGTGPDKGMPAIVPYDVNHGWYVKVQGSYAIGDANVGVYQSSGLPARWRICNVGSNNAIDSDDECGTTDGKLGDGETILGLSQAESNRHVRTSAEAILDAARQRNLKVVKINRESLKVGNLMSHNEGVQCHDFMSAEDCNLLFNVCDPVICPNTRCNLGGEYQVADVIQTGIVGSILLCLPNWNEGILVPICTTGVQAGIDGYTNILKAHRDCLQENVETGRLTGICDEITSVYMCEFFWKQAAPLADIALPTVINAIFNGGARGGGEYRNVYAAWDNAKASTEFFTQNYAGNSFDAFQARSVAEAGTPVCRSFISSKAPSAFDVLTEPDSPPQFHAWFDSFIHSDATIPATAQYKVFYTIYAGKDAGVQFSVYLKNPGDSVFYNIPESIQVDSGFIGRGEGKTETKDFTAPDGYKELCVRINNKDECGFKQVSTSFAVNYLRDELVKGELTNTDINSERACISGTTSLASLSNVNIQSAAGELLNPDIEQRGIVRVCSTRNPGGSTDPTRYVEVGNCGSETDKCWLDKNSVENALTDANKGAQSVTLEELEQEQLNKLKEEGKVVDEIDLKGEIEKIWAAGKLDNKLQMIDELFIRLVFNHHKAKVLLEKAKILKEEFLRNVRTVTRSEAETPEVPATDVRDISTGNSNNNADGEVSVGEVATFENLVLKEELFNQRGEEERVLVFYFGNERIEGIYLFEGENRIFIVDSDSGNIIPVGYTQWYGSFSVDFDIVERYNVSERVKEILRLINGKSYDSVSQNIES